MIVISYRRRYDFTRYYIKYSVFSLVWMASKTKSKLKEETASKMDTERVRGHEAITGGTML